MEEEAEDQERKNVQRWSAGQKERVVLRLLRGESLEVVTREEGVAAHTLAEWREAFLRAGREGLKRRRSEPLERELKDARAKVGELTMKLELLEGKDDLLRRGRRSKS